MATFSSAHSNIGNYPRGHTRYAIPEYATYQPYSGNVVFSDNVQNYPTYVKRGTVTYPIGQYNGLSGVTTAAAAASYPYQQPIVSQVPSSSGIGSVAVTSAPATVATPVTGSVTTPASNPTTVTTPVVSGPNTNFEDISMLSQQSYLSPGKPSMGNFNGENKFSTSQQDLLVVQNDIPGVGMTQTVGPSLTDTNGQFGGPVATADAQMGLPVDPLQLLRDNTEDQTDLRIGARPSLDFYGNPNLINGISSQYASLQTDNPMNFITAPSRTVYLGNIPPDLTVKDLLDHVRSGVIEEVKILPESNCAFVAFTDESSALLFHSDAILKRLNIGGRDIKIGWGKASKLDPAIAAKIAHDGATRNVYIGQLNVEPVVKDEETLRKDLEQFGEIDCIKMIPEKGIAFVHFASIAVAISVVSNLASVNQKYVSKKIFYGKDRCAFITKTQQHNAAQFLGLQSGFEKLIQFTDRKFISNALLQQSAAAAAIATSTGGPNNLGNRTIYLGNLPKDVKVEDICNVVRGGLLQSIKLLSDRYVCFITFIDPTAAAQFYAMSSLHGLTIQKKRCKIGWGKHSGPLPNALALAVGNGASRNIYIGNINMENKEFFNEENLRKIFRQYGEVEQINFLPEKNCCFINFTNISNAILALDKIKSIPEFKDLKINFGKDRCGNVPHRKH